MTMCGRVASAMACARMSVPPMRRQTLRFWGAPSAVSCSAIWRASSRVGVRMSAKMPVGSSDQRCRMGAAKAMVLPEPVREPPMQSLPAEGNGG